MKKIFLIAGHSAREGGAVNQKTGDNENIVSSCVISTTTNLLKDDGLIIVPNMTLSEKIKWINNHATDNDFVVEFHLDSSEQREEKGALCFYYGGSIESKNRATKMLDLYCNETGILSKGVTSDRQSRYGRLGIVRDTKGWSFLFELGSINNDLETIKEKGSQGVVKIINYLKCLK